MTIQPDKYYSPRTIAQNKWLVARDGAATYTTILHSIRASKLPARNVGSKAYPFYSVKGQDILDYNEKYQIL